MFSTFILKTVLAFTCVLYFSSTYAHAIENFGIKRFLHGCPFAFPCPPPPCDNPVFGPHDCCGSCPEPTSLALTVSEKRSVPDQSAKRSVRRHFFRKIASEMSHELRNRQFTRTTYPTTTECPYPCVHHGYHYCHPLPCHIPCVDGVKHPGDCCYQCPNGPNCIIDGEIIPEGKNVTLSSGDVAMCTNGDVNGGNVQIYHVFG